MTKESQETRTRVEHAPLSYLSMERLKNETFLNHHLMPLFQNKGVMVLLHLGYCCTKYACECKYKNQSLKSFFYFEDRCIT